MNQSICDQFVPYLEEIFAARPKRVHVTIWFHNRTDRITKSIFLERWLFAIAHKLYPHITPMITLYGPRDWRVKHSATFSASIKAAGAIAGNGNYVVEEFTKYISGYSFTWVDQTLTEEEGRDEHS